jgi:hypothetical protein
MEEETMASGSAAESPGKKAATWLPNDICEAETSREERK